MTPGAPVALPLDFVAVYGSGAAHEVLPFVNGVPQPGARPAARLVLHAAIDPETLAAWRAGGALCVPAPRLLALLAPEETERRFAGALDVGERYRHAVLQLAPQTEILRAAAEALPTEEAALRALMQRGLAELAITSPTRAAQALRDRSPGGGERPQPEPPASHPEPLAADPTEDEHALLERLFAGLQRSERASGALPFEPRRGQLEMAHAVLDALLDGSPLVIEAGTGVGKTIAYVLPLVVLAATHGARFVVSTHTHTLQHQLVERDLPELWRCFALEALPRPDGTGGGLRHAKLLGRTNYVCRTALLRAGRRAAANGGDFGTAQALLSLLRAKAGEIDLLAPWLEPRLRTEIQSRRETCAGNDCREAAECPVFVARATARAADLVVVNHALLFSDAAAEGSILGPGSGLVVDEAHHLEAVATEHLTLAVERAQAEALGLPLHRAQGAVAGAPALAGLQARLAALAPWVAALRERLPAFFDATEAVLPAAGVRRGRQAYRDGDEVFAGVRAAFAAVLESCSEVARRAAELHEECGSFADDAAEECGLALGLLASLAQEIAARLEFLVEAGREEYAFFLEFGADGPRLQRLAAAPLEVASDVQRLLRVVAPVTVYTSATLSVGGDFGYFRRRTGIDSKAACLEVPSPFDYATQCLVVQAQYLCEYDDANFEPLVAELLARLAERAPRRTLVLLTSHAALRRLYAELRQRRGPGAPLLAQDVTGGRSQLAARFASTPGAVLLGTASFWEGMDFPGSALEILVIAKLPFLVPDEPLVAARVARLRQQGENPFGDYVLPEAVLRFKQGFGRLVRSRQDRGVVLLLDTRLGERHYGADFVAALPAKPEIFHAPEPLVERVGSWLESHAAL